MEKYVNIALIILPILFAAGLGILARVKKIMTKDQIEGLQNFVIRIGVPCMLFNSCLTGEISGQSLGTMVIIIAFALAAALLSFRLNKKLLPYHNLPLLSCGKETGMLGIPLTIVLFGATQAYRMGVLDLAQGFIGIPVMSILSANTGSEASIGKLFKKVLTAPMLVFSLLGLALNLLGIRHMLADASLLPLITETTLFVGEPISALMLFCVGYNFSLTKEDRGAVFRVSGAHVAMHACFAGLAQLVLCLFPNVDPLTRWVIVLYYALPGSYLAPALGRTETERTVISSACSLLTIFTLIVFCVMAVIFA